MERKKERACPPNSTQRLVACLECKLILAMDQFISDYRGCPNCQTRITDYETLREYTTSNFAGMISVLGRTSAKSSWVCRWNELDHGHVPGVYAIDAKDEVTLVRRDRDRDSSADKSFDSSDDESRRGRDEREVNVKTERNAAYR